MNNKPIPVLGVLILNGAHWLKRQIESIDYPIENYLIINNNGRGELDKELNNLINKPHPFIKNFKLTTMPFNAGVAGGWNMIIKSFMNSPYWIISNHDVSFEPGFLEEMNTAAQNEDTQIVFGNAGDFDLGSFDLFLIKDTLIQSHGLFDENFYPAYCEDADYIMRLHNNPVKGVYGLTKKYYHGGSFDYYETGSNTRKDDPKLTAKLEGVNLKNYEYMTQKWGPGWRNMDPYKHPFNIEGLSSRITSFNLKFCRDKHLGF